MATLKAVHLKLRSQIKINLRKDWKIQKIFLIIFFFEGTILAHF